MADKKWKTADEIASLFFERFKAREPEEFPGHCIFDGDISVLKWQSWITTKQARWLNNQWMREDEDRRFNRHDAGYGYFEKDGIEYHWGLYIAPNRAGVLTISKRA